MLNIRQIAILLLVNIFFSSSYNKITNFNSTLIGIEKKGLPFPQLALLGAISFQLIGLIGILLKEFKLVDNSFKYYKYLQYSKYFLIVFTILATYFYHNIFTMENQNINFGKNMSIIGGLLLI